MTALPLQQPPKSLCLLRLSAIGDVTHMLPLIATLQHYWPQTRLTWIIGKAEYALLKSLDGIEFIVFDKSNGLAEYRKLRRSLSKRRFDLLLMLQVAMRANLISLLINADQKIGYDKSRSRDFQSWFCQQRIEGPDRVHQLDTFFQFLETIGLTQRRMDWLLQATDEDREFARGHLGQQAAVVINPCSSARANNWRNWPEASYARVIDHLMERGLKVILSGGPDAAEAAFCERVVRACAGTPVNLAGKTSLTQLLALLELSQFMIAPDTGPAHMGTVAGIPVIGLYASSNPLRTGPYNSQQTLVNVYPQALQHYNHKSLDQARWGERVRDPQVMEMISVEAVIQRIDLCLQSQSK